MTTFFLSAWPQEPIICQFMRIIIYIRVFHKHSTLAILGQGNIFRSVCQEYSVHRRGAWSQEGCLVRGGVETPPGRLVLRVVRILLECILVFPHICSFLPYLHHMILVNRKLDVSGYKCITFQGC